MTERIALTGDELVRFRDLAANVLGFQLGPERDRDLAAAVSEARSAATRTRGRPVDLQTLHDLLRAGLDPVALEAFVSGLTINETHVFRHRAQLEAITDHVLPELIEARSAQRRLRLWSAACATGEEAWTLAIALERTGIDLSGWDVRILATDVDDRALAAAERGRYGPRSFREVGDDVVDAHFVRSDGAHVEIAERHRRHVRFGHLNLVTDSYPSAANGTTDVDLVLCRNVLIYLQPDRAREVLRRITASLLPGGYLAVGPSEVAALGFAGLATRSFRGAFLHQRPGGPVTTEASAGADATPPPPPPLRSPSSLERPPTAIAAARRLADGGDLVGAGAALHALIDRNPLDAEAHVVLSLVDLEAGRTDLAMAALRRCLFLDPNLVAGLLAQIVVLRVIGDTDRARAVAERVARLLEGRRDADVLPATDGQTVGGARADLRRYLDAGAR